MTKHELTNALSRDESRLVDERAIRDYGMTGLVLMENAGRGCADLLEQLGIGGPIVICCGKGNNGGDGLVLARHLEARGHIVRVVLACDPEQLTGDAAANYRILVHAETPLSICLGTSGSQPFEESLLGADWVVDALLGTGASGAPRPPLSQCIDAINQYPGNARRLAIDLPSGLDCDSGLAAGSVIRADHTATLVAPKIGFRSPAAIPNLGTVHVLDIGVPGKLLHQVLRERPSRLV